MAFSVPKRKVYKQQAEKKPGDRVPNRFACMSTESDSKLTHQTAEMKRMRWTREVMDNPQMLHGSGAGGTPLSSLLPGERGRIVALGLGMGRQHHFRRMGLREGKIVTVIATQPARGPFVIDVDGTQIAIGRGMAHHIVVERL